MPLDSDDSTRRPRKNWNQNKSHLPKYSSLPELQLVVKEPAVIYHCPQCGFTNSFILLNPVCLWCAWTCKEAQHEFTSSVPRVRRASAPPGAFIKVDLSPWKCTFLAGDPAFNPPDAPLKQTESKASSSIIDSPPFVRSLSPCMPIHQNFDATAVDLHGDHNHDFDTSAANDYRQRDPVTVIPESLADVDKATRSSSTHSLPFAQSTTERVEFTPEQHNSAMELKLSQGAFNIGRADKMPAFHCDHDDTHEPAKNVSDHEITLPPIKSPHPKHQIFRPLRRKNHLHVMPCPPDPEASEPIAISLTLHRSSPLTSSHIGKKSSQRLSHTHTRAHSHPQSSVASVSSGSGVTPPLTPTHQQRLSPPPDSSPVRLGHPSRPYYTAIRKNGISPPTPSRSRPQSQPAPSFHLGFDLAHAVADTTNASRHLSMSAVLPIPPAFSALYDADDDDNDDDVDFEVHSGPTNSARLSLSSSVHRVSYDSHTQTHARHARSLSRASKGMVSSNRSHGVGFSMSGETELRMALAASSPSGIPTTFGRRTTAAQDGFRFRETVIPSENNNNNHKANTGSDYLHTRYVGGSKDSFMGRVKKLRKGLKEMLMN